jgi:uncharacterized protein YbjQ (UPF0145 family)
LEENEKTTEDYDKDIEEIEKKRDDALADLDKRAEDATAEQLMQIEHDRQNYINKYGMEIDKLKREKLNYQARKYAEDLLKYRNAPHGMPEPSGRGLTDEQKKAVQNAVAGASNDDGRVFGKGASGVDYDKLWKDTRNPRVLALIAIKAWLDAGGSINAGLGTAPTTTGPVNVLKNTNMAAKAKEAQALKNLSTGRTTANNLMEQMALEAGQQGKGKVINENLGDKRLPSGSSKLQITAESASGNRVTVHSVKTPKGNIVDVKIVHPEQ